MVTRSSAGKKPTIAEKWGHPRSLLKGGGFTNSHRATACNIPPPVTIQECTIKRSRQRGFSKIASPDTGGGPFSLVNVEATITVLPALWQWKKNHGGFFVSSRWLRTVPQEIKALSGDASALPDKMGSTGNGGAPFAEATNKHSPCTTSTSRAHCGNGPHRGDPKSLLTISFGLRLPKAESRSSPKTASEKGATCSLPRASAKKPKCPAPLCGSSLL